MVMNNGKSPKSSSSGKASSGKATGKPSATLNTCGIPFPSESTRGSSAKATPS